MSCIQRTIELNNHGTICLTSSHGQGPQALKCFKAALSLLSQTCDEAKNSREGEDQDQERRNIPIVVHRSNPITMAPPSSSSCSSSSEVNTATVGRCAFYMSYDGTLALDDDIEYPNARSMAAASYETYTFQSAIILFNLALGLHMKGSYTGDVAALQRARHLYEHCLQLLNLVGHLSNDQAKIIHAEALRNLADICTKIGDYNALRCVLDALVLLNVKVIMDHEEEEIESFKPAAAA